MLPPSSVKMRKALRGSFEEHDVRPLEFRGLVSGLRTAVQVVHCTTPGVAIHRDDNVYGVHKYTWRPSVSDSGTGKPLCLELQ